MIQTIVAELLELGDQNIAEFIRHIARAGEGTQIPAVPAAPAVVPGRGPAGHNYTMPPRPPSLVG